jgi:N-acetyl-beta-hexosaminidase
MPQNISYRSGSFMLHSKTVIQTNDVTSFEAEFLQESIKNQTGLDLKIVKVVPNSVASINLVFDVEGPEAGNFKEDYKVEVAAKSITIKAVYNQGIFYGIQTLIGYQNTLLSTS